MEGFMKESRDVLTVFHVSTRIVNFSLMFQSSVLVWFIYFSTFMVFEGRFSKESVDCIVDNKDENFLKAVNRWCLSYGLFTSPNGTITTNTSNRQRLIYYYWVPYALTLHALIMNLSGRLRKSKERGVMEGFLKYFISHGFLTAAPSESKVSEGKKNYANPFGAETFKQLKEKRTPAEQSKEEPCSVPDMKNGNNLSNVPSDMSLIRTRSIRTAAKVLERRIQERCNVDWSSSLVGCEVLSLALQVSVGFYYNYLFSGNYLHLGLSSTQRLEQLFPSLAKCEFFHVGASGSYVMKDALCVLPQNVLYRVILVVIWWSNLVFIVSGVGGLFFRVLEAMIFRQEWYIRNSGFGTEPAEIKVAKELTYWDFLFFKYLKENIGLTNYRMVIKNFTSYSKIDEGPQDTSEVDRELWV